MSGGFVGAFLLTKTEINLMELSRPNKTMSSKEIAQVTGKEHPHVLRDIRVMIDELEKGNPNMDSNDYQVVTLPNGMTQEILLNEELSLCLGAGYNVNLRMKIIKRWKELEVGFQLPTNFREALLLAADQQLKIENQEKIILKLEPRSLYFEKMVNSDGLISMEECAKLLNIKDIGRNKLYKSLRESKVIMKFSTTPYQHFVTKGYFELKEELIEIQKSSSVVRKVNTTTYVTQKGLAFIFKLFGLTEKAA